MMNVQIRSVKKSWNTWGCLRSLWGGNAAGREGGRESSAGRHFCGSGRNEGSIYNHLAVWNEMKVGGELALSSQCQDNLIRASRDSSMAPTLSSELFGKLLLFRIPSIKLQLSASQLLIFPTLFDAFCIFSLSQGTFSTRLIFLSHEELMAQTHIIVHIQKHKNLHTPKNIEYTICAFVHASGCLVLGWFF